MPCLTHASAIGYWLSSQSHKERTRAIFENIKGAPLTLDMRCLLQSEIESKASAERRADNALSSAAALQSSTESVLSGYRIAQSRYKPCLLQELLSSPVRPNRAAGDLPTSTLLAREEALRIAHAYSLCTPIHIGFPNDASRQKGPAVASHVISASALQDAYRHPDGSFSVVTPECALLQAASILGMRNLDALITLCAEFFAVYAIDENDVTGVLRRQALTNRQRCTDFLSRCGNVHGKKALARAIQAAPELCASPPEIALGIMLTRPFSQGGYNQTDASFNARVDTSSFYRDGTTHTRFCDVFLSQSNLAIEYLGAVHGESGKIDSDAIRQVELHACGIQLLEMTRAQLARFDETERFMRNAVLRTTHTTRNAALNKYIARRRTLRANVFAELKQSRWISETHHT